MSREWTNHEEAILRAHYPVTGASVCAEKLPHRSTHCIYARANMMGLKAPKRTGRGLFKRKYPLEPWIDTAIREGYAAAKKPGDITDLANRVARPRNWVMERARELGLGPSGVQARPWEQAELDVLEQYATCTVRYIADQLRRAGYRRSVAGIAVMLHRRQFDRKDPNSWSAHEVGKLLGVAGPTVLRWIGDRGLVATKRGTAHPHDAWQIQRADLRKWLTKNHAAIDLRKVDQTWFMDLAFGPET